MERAFQWPTGIRHWTGTPKLQDWKCRTTDAVGAGGDLLFPLVSHFNFRDFQRENFSTFRYRYGDKWPTTIQHNTIKYYFIKKATNL